ncbi:MAG: Uma2 family endonuclease [Planctomycetia bacterium]
MATAIIFEDSLTVPACAGLGEFRRWTRSGDFPDRGRIDWIEGRIEIDMSPENLFTHGTLKTELASKIYGVIRAADRGEVFIDRTRVVCPAANLSVEPDVVVVTHTALDGGRVSFVPASGHEASFMEIEGGPDLVVEIVSDASVHKDTRRLPPAYYMAGVTELWIVDARAQPPVFRVFGRGPREYEALQPQAEGWIESAVLGRQVRLMVHDTARGTPRYDLEIRQPH